MAVRAARRGVPAMRRARLDALLVDRGEAESREAAQRLVLAGRVLVGDRCVDKPGARVDPAEPIRVKRPASRFVGRGGEKLAAALADLGITVVGLRVLDCGLSTGGFTDCLLAAGAREVVGVDVGYGQVAPRIRSDPRVTLLERTNLRHVTRDRLPWAPELATLDLSFISLELVLPVVRSLLAASGSVIALVKPQFEVGRGRVGKGGVVRDPELHRETLERVAAAARRCGFRVVGSVASRMTGADGNREFFLHLATTGEDRAVDFGEVVTGP
jgi:23S rRNA (cytidine1920-2'-O)/16S rRNA (cytidine1409-2'-O)-methyltransferase